MTLVVYSPLCLDSCALPSQGKEEIKSKEKIVYWIESIIESARLSAENALLQQIVASQTSINPTVVDRSLINPVDASVANRSAPANRLRRANPILEETSEDYNSAESSPMSDAITREAHCVYDMNMAQVGHAFAPLAQEAEVPVRVERTLMEPAKQDKAPFMARRALARQMAEQLNAVLDNNVVAPLTALPTMKRQISDVTANELVVAPTLTRSASAPSGLPEFDCEICRETSTGSVLWACHACHPMRICIPCMRIMWLDQLTKKQFYVSSFFCFECKAPISFAEWAQAVTPSMAETFWSNVHGAFKIHCANCEEDPSLLFYDASYMLQDLHMDKVAEAETYVFDTLFHGDENLKKAFKEHVHSVESLEKEAPAKFVAFMFSAIKESLQRSSGSFDGDSSPKLMEEAQTIFRHAMTPKSLLKHEDSADSFVECAPIALIKDLERRAMVLLTVLKRDGANISMPCCTRPVCFNCKTFSENFGWHEDQTCAEVVSAQLEEDGNVHTCPNCFVRFIHGGGCSWMNCVCGHSFTINPE